MFKKIIKFFIQAIFIFLFFYFFKKTSFPLKENLPVNLFFRIDLLLALFTTISTFYFSYLFLPSILIFIMLLLLGNFFCFWICPFGGIIDFSNLIFLRKRWKKVSIRLPLWIRKIKIFILIGIIIISFVKIPFILWIFDPYVILFRAILFKKILVVFIFIVFLSILIPRFWCNNICPLGYINYLVGVKLRNKLKKRLKK